MSYEAVPCMVRAPSQDGRKGTILGVIIRPSSSQEGTHVNPLPPPPGVIPIKGAKSIVIQPGSKRSLILSTDQIQKMMNGKGVRDSPHSLRSPLPTSFVSSSLFPIPHPNFTSAQLLEMGLSPSSIRIHSGVGGVSSSSTESEIQTVPTSPPQFYLEHRNEERAEDEAKFDDMPRLKAIDEEETAASCSSSIPPPLDESSIWQQSECETSLPSSLTKTSWNPEEIATQLLSMAAFDPQKIQEVTALMLQRSREDLGKKEYNKKRKNEKSDSNLVKKKVRREWCESVATTSAEKTEIENRDASEEEPLDEGARLVMYRLAMRRRIYNKMDETSDGVIASLSQLSIGERWRKSKERINPLFSPIQWQDIKRRISLSEIFKTEKGAKRKGVETDGRRSTIQKKRRRKEELKEPTMKLNRRREKAMENFHNIQTNVIDDSLLLPSLSSPFPCDCTKGGCSSPSECLNRSLRIFCTSSFCRLPNCTNRFSASSSLFLSKGILKTSQPKKANQFLGEIVGEVISISSMTSRLSSMAASPIRAFSFAPHLFIDSTSKGNIARFIRHSCKPNSSIQIWWESSVPHMCIFSRIPISSNSIITADLSFLTPFSFSCTCSEECCRSGIPSSNSLLLHQSTLYSSLYSSTPSCKLFLRRNLKTLREGRVYRNSRSSLYNLYLLIDQKFRRLDGKVKREYAPFLQKLRRASLNEDTILFACVISRIQEIMVDPVESLSLNCIRNRLIRENDLKEDEGKTKKKSRKSDWHPSRCTDTSYLDAGIPIGSYNPDEWNGEENKDAVRCVCGVLEDDGEMVQCDACEFWLHSDCIHPTPSTHSFKCPLCVEGISTPHGDVVLKNQPQIRLEGCTYYKALENRKKMQIRVAECVYVRRMSEHHKKIIRALEQKKRKLNEPSEEESLLVHDQDDTVPPRSMLRVFRVERLFESPGGHRFLFGFYYARPHETFCDENRLFHPNEVFATPFYDTLPLDAVVGKCVILEPRVFCEGRPLFPSYKEHDVLVCEYQLDRNQRHFDKCRNLYKLNKEPYAFQRFESNRSLQRCFTPFTYSSIVTHNTAQTGSDNFRYQCLQSAKLTRIVDSLLITGN